MLPMLGQNLPRHLFACRPTPVTILSLQASAFRLKGWGEGGALDMLALDME